MYFSKTQDDENKVGRFFCKGKAGRLVNQSNRRMSLERPLDDHKDATGIKPDAGGIREKKDVFPSGQSEGGINFSEV